MKNIPENIRLVANSTLPLVVVLILFVAVGNFGFSKISDLRTQIGVAQTLQNTLTQKVNLLKAVSGSVANYSSSAAIALPDANTSLAVISQLKNLSIGNAVLISGIKGGSETTDSSGLSKTDVGFEVEGSRDAVIAFLKSVSTIAPISQVNNIKMTESGDTVKAGVTVRSYWAAIPTTLPTSGQAISDLTPDERNILTSVNLLTPPGFSVIPPAQAGGRPNPFTQ